MSLGTQTSTADKLRLAAVTSIAVAAIVMGLKYLAYRVTGSVALYSDALESVINIVAAVAALVALQVSALPADANHPFGHHKAEYFSAVIEGVLIVLAALAILRASYLGLLHPRPIEATWLGLAITVAATALNGVWCWYLVRNGRRWRSPALVADGKHLLADVVSSVGVVAGVALVAVTGVAVLDPLLAAAVALNILWSGYALVRGSVGGLMDEAASPDQLDRIKGAISASGVGAIEAHDLRTRHAGRTTFIDFHLVVPGEMSVREAHGICDRIEAALREDIQGAAVVIHVEPHDKAKHFGLLVL